MQTCRHCKAEFEITDADKEFYKKIPTPPPTLCPNCRQQRRLSFRNERKLYHRKSDLSGKQIISMYSPDKTYKVFDQEEWWSDKWDGTDYGREFDFSRGFFEQFNDLMKVVPRINLINKEHENSEYCNFSLLNKNSYLLFTSGESEDSYSSSRIWQCKDCCDCMNVNRSELCYDCINLDRCYHCGWLQNCVDSSDCFFSENLRGCKNCIGCFGLINRSYCVNNQQVDKATYEKILAKCLENVDMAKSSFEAFLKHIPRKYIDGIGFENCTGNNIQFSKNAHACFDVMNIEDCKFVTNATFMKDAYDIDNDDRSTLAYEVVGGESNYNHAWNDICWFDRDCYYSSLCFHSEHLFGCVGLKRQKYCILNKQYSETEYAALTQKIIKHMVQTGEWGEFFPSYVSPFGYNETMACDYYPLEKADAIKNGWNWHTEEKTEQNYLGPKYQIPANIKDVDDDIVSKILICESTGMPYKITPQELRFYRKMQIPIPRKCYEKQLRDKIVPGNMRKLIHRQCTNCGTDVETVYSPSTLESIYCEKCYLATIS